MLYASCVQKATAKRTVKRIDQPVKVHGSLSVHNILFLIKFMDPSGHNSSAIMGPFPLFTQPMFPVPPHSMDLMDPYPPMSRGCSLGALFLLV
jgi:hypothetical protein